MFQCIKVQYNSYCVENSSGPLQIKGNHLDIISQREGPSSLKPLLNGLSEGKCCHLLHICLVSYEYMLHCILI